MSPAVQRWRVIRIDDPPPAWKVIESTRKLLTRPRRRPDGGHRFRVPLVRLRGLAVAARGRERPYQITVQALVVRLELQHPAEVEQRLVGLARTAGQ